MSGSLEPVSSKMMLAGKVTINQHDYYVPLVPCVTNFASVPGLNVLLPLP